MSTLDEWVADHAENCDCHLDEPCDCGQAERVKELAQLRAELAERDKTIAEAKKLLLYVQEKISPLNPFKEQVDAYLSICPTSESEKKQ